TNYKAYKPDPWDNKFHNNVLKIEKHYHTGITSSSTSAQKPVNYSHYLKENGEFLQFHSWKKLREYILTSEPFLKHFQIGKYSPYLNETRQKWEESLTIEYKIAVY
ncbi:MAG: hypothetical protein IPJ43_12620, partial [Saprospiraceae bacterium]|nr:hypothetical protein [Saprospiraceae bacterium]